MTSLLKAVLMGIFSKLPDSPLTEYFANMHMEFYDYLNWFLPLDICATIFSAWLVCIGLFYIYLMIKTMVNKTIEGIAKTIDVFT